MLFDFLNGEIGEKNCLALGNFDKKLLIFLRKCGLNILSKKLSYLYKAGQKSFDVIFFFNSDKNFEHIGEILIFSREILKKEGFLVFLRVKSKKEKINFFKLHKIFKKTKKSGFFLHRDPFEIFLSNNTFEIIILRKNPLSIILDARAIEESMGGVGSYIVQLSNYILKKGDLPILLSTRKISLNVDGAQKVVIPVFINYFFWEQVQLLIFLLRTDFAVYHATMNHGIPFFLFKKTLLTVHDLIPIYFKNYFSRAHFPIFSKSLYYLSIMISIIKANKIFYTSEEVKKQIAGISFLFSEKKLKKILVPIKDKFFLEKNFFIPKKKYVLYHGGIAERKNILKLLEAFCLFVEKRRGWKLCITGNGDPFLLQILKSKAEELRISKEVVFLGWIEKESDLTNLVRNASLVVYPSLDEGLGLPVVEAMASRTPVASSNLPPIIEFCSDVPFFFDPHSATDIFKKMIFATTKKNKRRLEKGVKLAKKFKAKHIFHETYSQYYHLISNP